MRPSSQASTTTTLAVDIGPSVYGQSVTLSATVGVVSPGSGSPSGSVTFFDGSTPLGTASLIGNQASLTVSTLAAASHNLTAQYLGDDSSNSFKGSTSAVVNEIVSQASTTTTLTIDIGPSVYGQPVTLSATVGVVSPGLGIPSGSVTFFDGSTPLGTASLIGNQASLTVSTLAAASHNLTAQYLGDDSSNSFKGSTSAVVNEIVSQASTTTTLAVDNNPSAFGQSVIFTASVASASPGAGVVTGTVTFKDGTIVLGNGTLGTNGIATFSTSALPQPLTVGSHSITATYSGDNNYVGSTSDMLSEAVIKNGGTMVTVNSSANPSLLHQSISFTVVVSAAGSSGIPTGTVQFQIDGTKFGSPVTLAGGTAASGSTSSLAIGKHKVTAVYGGDANFVASTSPVLTQVVNKDGSTTSIASSINPSSFGQSVTFTATVAAVAPGIGAPTGTVSFKDGTTTLGKGTLDGTGKATLTVPSGSIRPLSASASPHSITAVYGGDANFATSTSPVLTQVVNKDGSTTSVVSSINPSSFGQSVTFTATVAAAAPGSGTPTGTVTFYDGSSKLGNGALNNSGVAVLTTSRLTAMTHTITAVYGGNANFTTSTSSAMSQVVNPAGTTINVTSSTNSTNSTIFGQSVTFTATVAAVGPGSGTPKGRVTFYDGTNTLGTITLSGGKASLTTSQLSAGSHSITVVYGGDSNFTTSTSPMIIQSVQQSATTTSLTSSDTTAVSGQSVTFTAVVKAVTPGKGTPTGKVAFLDGSTLLDYGMLDNTGRAKFTTSNLPVGAYTIAAVYFEDNNFTTSTSAGVNQTVDQASTAIGVVSSANPSASGQSVTLTATVSVKAPGSGTPTGSVIFYDGTTVLGTVPVSASDGSASLPNVTLAVGTHSIKVVYGGDTNFKTSTSAILKQVVTQQAAAAPLVVSASAVDLALASLQDETTAGLIESLAMEQVSFSTNGQQRSAQS